jgi:hypothetical protein
MIRTRTSGEARKKEKTRFFDNPQTLAACVVSSPSLPANRFRVSGSGSGRSVRWVAAAPARRRSSRRRRRRSMTDRSASGALMPRRGAPPPQLLLLFTFFHRTSVFLLGWFDSKVPCLVFLAILKQRFSTFCRLFFFSFMTMNFP